MFKRTSLKRTPLKKRAPLNRGSTKLKKVYKVVDNSDMKNVFVIYWNEKPHICQSCGARLGNELKSYHIDHLLEKSKYPQFKLEPKNFYIVCMSCHEAKTIGNPTIKHQEAIEQVKQILLTKEKLKEKYEI